MLRTTEALRHVVGQGVGKHSTTHPCSLPAPACSHLATSMDLGEGSKWQGSATEDVGMKPAYSPREKMHSVGRGKHHRDMFLCT